MGSVGIEALRKIENGSSRRDNKTLKKYEKKQEKLAKKKTP